MLSKRLGRQTVRLGEPVSVVSFANIGGKQEAQGPLAGYFDELNQDPYFGQKSWEKGESAMQQFALQKAMEKGGLGAEDLDYVLAGDLLNQCIGTSFGLRDFKIPFYGLYGACSTMGESLSPAALHSHGAAVYINRVKFRHEVRGKALRIQLDLSLNAVGVDNMAHRDIYRTHESPSLP